MPKKPFKQMPEYFFRVKLIFLLPAFFLFSVAKSYSQENNEKRLIPPFRIELANGDSLFAKDLKKNVPAMIVYFSPSCEHCQAFTRDLLEKMNQLQGIQIIYITYLPVNEIKGFVKDFDLAKYSNFKVGTEGYSFTVQKFYHVTNFPFLALYDKSGTLSQFYRTPPKMDVLVNKFDGMD